MYISCVSKFPVMRMHHFYNAGYFRIEHYISKILLVIQERGKIDHVLIKWSVHLLRECSHSLSLLKLQHMPGSEGLLAMIFHMGDSQNFQNPFPLWFVSILRKWN